MKLRFAKASFNVRRWVSNDEKLMQLINRNENDLDVQPRGENPKVLGIVWDPCKDTFSLGVRHIFEKAEHVPPTKRNILKSIASVYDPLGLLQNITISLKILFQEICISGAGWDEIIINELQEKWAQIIQGFKMHEDVEIKRLYIPKDLTELVVRVYLHGFADASEIAYGAMIYVKFVTSSGTVGVKLVTAKSRVVPARKKFTIPRTELLGNFILAKLMTNVRQALKEELVIDNFLCWSDSSIALSWIRSYKKELKPFEENRVVEIRKHASPLNWFHCRSEENPADIITRFYVVDDSRHDLYINGPTFLKEINEEQKIEGNDPLKSNIGNGDNQEKEVQVNDVQIAVKPSVHWTF